MKPIAGLTMAACIAILFASGGAIAATFEGLEAGGEIGYSFALTEGLAYPVAIHGTAARARVGYGFNESLGIEATFGLSWYQSYQPYTEKVIAGDDGTASSTYDVGATLERTRIQDFSLCLVYALDVYRVIPSISLGVATARLLQTLGQATTTVHEISIPFAVALDMEVNTHIFVGVGFRLDNYMLDRSPFPTRGSVMIRVTYRRNVRNLGRESKSR